MKKVLFSVWQDGEQVDRNFENYILAMRKLEAKRIGYNPVAMRAAGGKQFGFVVDIDSRTTLELVHGIVAASNQANYVEIYPSEVRLYYTASGSSERLGQLTEISYPESKGRMGYLNLDNDLFYTFE